MSRKKRTRKGIESLRKRKEEHAKKIMGTKKSHLRKYWEKEIIRFEREIDKKTKGLKRK